MQPNTPDPTNPQPVVFTAAPETPGIPQPLTPQPMMASPQPIQLQPSADFTASPASIPAGSKWRILKLVAYVVVPLVFLAAGYGLSNLMVSTTHSKATSTAKSFIAALNTGNNTKAYALGSTTLHKAQSQSQFNSGVGNVKTSSPRYISQATQFSSNGSTATFIAVEDGLVPTSTGSTTGTFTVTLSKTGLTGWAVDAVNIQ